MLSPPRDARAAVLQPSFLTGLTLAALAAISWGIQLPLARDAFATVDAFHITAVRYAVAALVLTPVLVWREGLASLSYRGAAGTAWLLGLFGMCGSPMLVFFGMSMSRAEHAVVIVTMQPAIAVLVYWLLRGRTPATFTLLCIAVAFLGVVLVVTRGQLAFAESPRQLLGDAIIFLGAACWVVYTIGIGRLTGWSTWRITVLTMYPGALATSALTAVLVFTGYIGSPGLADYAAVGWEIGYLTFVGVLAAMLAWNYGTRHIGALNATLLINCMPVATFVYRALQGYRFVWLEVLGAGLVVGALVANNLFLRRRALREAAQAVV